MRKIFCYFVFTFLIIGCQNSNQPQLKLKDFKDDIGVKELGKRLIHLPFGLNSMEASNDEVDEIFIAVHGGNSEGYEWIYPLKTIDSKNKHMYFNRWTDNGCYQDSAENLVKDISNILSQNPALKKVSLMGHSYGGILVTHILKIWQASTPIEVHVVASPLQGMPMLESMCGYKPIEKIPKNSVLFEWRTQQQLDNVYKDFFEDPQKVDIEGSFVSTLPDTYKGNRLGHNWSISWVADQAF
mgnify:FL=1